MNLTPNIYSIFSGVVPSYTIRSTKLMICLFSYFLSSTCFASGVLIVNSNTSIEKYYKASQGFRVASIPISSTVNLGNRDIHDRELKRLISRDNPQLIYSVGSKAYMLARETSKNLPILFSSVLNWRRLPINKHTYGISNEVPSAYQLTVYRYFFPRIKTLGVIYSEKFNEQWVAKAVRHAQDLGITLIAKSINNKDDFNHTLSNLLPDIQALWLTADPVILSSSHAVKSLFRLAGQQKVPVLTYNMAFIKYGATFVISADPITMGIQAAGLANDILADIEIKNRVQNPAGTQIGLSIKLLKKYGVYLNEESLDSVNEIFQ